MTSTALLDLPNEILEDILESADIALPTLYGLGLSCHRLKEICIPLYLKHSGSPHPEDACRITVPRARRSNVDLKVFALATWITKTKRLECHFADEKEGMGGIDAMLTEETSALAALMELARGMQKEGARKPRRNFKTLLLQLSKLQSLIARFASVEEVVLNFNPEEQAFTRFSDWDAIFWSEAMGKLLNTIIVRGCTKLEVRGLHQVNDIYILVSPIPPTFTRYPPTVSKNPSSPPTDPSAVQKPQDILSGPTWIYKWNGRTGSRLEDRKPRILTALSASARSSCRLTDFTIASISLLCPPVLQWTYSILSSPSLVSLTLCDAPDFEINWKVVATLLAQACPWLKRLTLSTSNGTSTSWRDIKSLMCAFPQLEYLSADDPHTLSWISMSSILDSERHLEQTLHLSQSITEMRLSENWLDYLGLTLQDFPELRKLSASPPSDRTPFSFPPHKTIASLGVTELHFMFNPGAASDEDIVRMPLVHLPQASDDSFWPTDSVSGVELVFARHTSLGTHDTGEVQTARRWFAKFPELKRVALTWKVGDPEAQLAAAQKFCRDTMAEVCKKLEHFEVNGEVWNKRRIRKVLEAEAPAASSI